MRGNGHGNGTHTGNGHDPFDEPPPGWDDDEPRPPSNPFRLPIGEHPEEPFLPLDYATIDDKPPFGRDWLVEGWFPMFETIGCGGPGGEGKTLLAHQLATCAVLGQDWLGMHVKQMKAALVLCEDRELDAHLRQADINRHYNCTMKDLAGHLLTLPRRNSENNYLGIFDRDGDLHLTTFFRQLLAKLKEFGARLVILDTRADVFRGNQNDEAHARMFVRRVCDHLAWELQGIVMLLFQPSMTGLSSRTGTSGSVQWDAAFRARTYLQTPQPPKAKEDEPEVEADPNLRQLDLLKSNFAAKGDSLDIRWEKGVFVLNSAPPPAGAGLQADFTKAAADFLECLDRFTDSGRAVSSVPGIYYAPRLFAEALQPEAGKKEVNQTCLMLKRAMTILFSKQKIKDEPFDPRKQGKGRTRIVRVE